MARQRRKPFSSIIPTELRKAAAREQKDADGRREAAREQAKREQTCTDVAFKFGRAEEALWLADADPAPSLDRFHDALRDAVRAMAEAGRLKDWERVKLDQLYERDRTLGARIMSRASFDWACQLLDKARADHLAPGYLAETWVMREMRDAFHWLRIIVMGLAGVSAIPPGLEPEPAPPLATVPDALPPIYWYDDRTYRVGDGEPVVVSERDDGLLQAFIGHSVLDKPLLTKRAGMDRQPDQLATAMKRLTKKYRGQFGRAIHCPGKRGQGGYRADVIDARPGKSVS